MVEAGAKEVAEEEMVQALEHGARGDQGDHRRHRRAGRAGRQEEDRGQGRRSARSSTARSRRRPRAARRRDAHQGQARELHHGRPGARRPRRRHSRRRDRAAQATPSRSSRSSRRRSCATRSSSAASGSTAAPSTRSARSRIEVGVLPRTHGSSLLHARRDPGARHRDARHRRRPAEDRDGRRRDVEALHAPLQLPAVLGRRSAVPARPRPPRDRPRRARRARARADDAGRREVPLHRPHRLRHPRVERLVVDGVGLRRHRWR